LGKLVTAVSQIDDARSRPLVESVLARIQELAPEYIGVAKLMLTIIDTRARNDGRWWVPEDIAAPPSSERVSSATSGFSRHDVDRVLSDL
jgi:hypothetical protein